MADDQTTSPQADAPPPEASASWMSDVQRVLALIIIGVLVAAAVALVMRVVISAAVDDVLDLTKTLLAALVNMGLIALGFFFGNTLAKMQNDRAQSRLVDKLSPAAPTAVLAPVAPVSDPAPKV